MVLEQQMLDWIKGQFQPKAMIQSIIPLYGGTSANMYKIVLKDQEIVLRVIVDETWLKEEPDLLLHEATALQYAASLDVPSPTHISTDKDGTNSGAPALMMTKLGGEIVLKPNWLQGWLKAMAEVLNDIHTPPLQHFPYPYASYVEPKEFSIPTWTNHQEKWLALIDYVEKIQPHIDETFLHRDYQPNNILWTEGKITGVVDWINACYGPRGVDVGHCRWNIAMLHGVDAAEDFLDYYRQAAPAFDYTPYWDIVGLLDVVTDPLEVYAGWKLFGFEDFTEIAMAEKMDTYMCCLWKKINE